MQLPVLSVEESQSEALGDMTRNVFFSPSRGNSRYMRMALVTGPQGARSALHTHLGNEAIYTWKGECMLEIEGRQYTVGPGQALMVPPDVYHPLTVTSEEPWYAICFYCDECPALKSQRSGLELRQEQPCVTTATEVQPAPMGGLQRRVLFTPSQHPVNFLRLAFVEGPQGAKGALHTHPGNEILFTIGGGVEQMLEDGPQPVPLGYGAAIPPGLAHQPVVASEEPWQAVCCFCDECPALKAALTAA